MRTKKAIFVAALIIVTFFVGVFASRVVRADELDDITKQLATLSRDLQDKEANQQALARQLGDIRARVAFVESEIPKREREIANEEKQLAHLKDRLDERIVSYYKSVSKNFVTIINFLVATNLDNSLRVFFYQQTVISEDRRNITNTVRRILALDEKKKELVGEKQRLASANAEIDRQSKLIGAEISSKKQEVAALSARQQQLVAAKQASLNIPRSAGIGAKGCSSDLTNGRNPGFSPRFGFFTFGAPHRNYMSQYGAKGRAEAGQPYTEILNFYYGGVALSDTGDTNIVVDGTNEYGQTFSNESMNLEDYVKHLYEMPSSWPAEALKAQAVAARTYGLNRMRALGKVQPNQGHQVVKKELNAQAWIDAVDATKGKILGSDPIFSEYSISHGGYVRNLSKYDGSGGNPGNFSDLISRAYDKDSPWFYCDWGSRSEYGGTAWLKTSEVADIANVILLGQADSSTSIHLSPTDSGVPDTWDAERVKNELKNRGKKNFNSINSVSMGADFGSGITNSVTVSGDAGSETFSGDDFRRWFNARAPANIFINGLLFNAEIQ